MTNYAPKLKGSRLEVEMLPSGVTEYAPKSEMVTTSLRTERPRGEDWTRKEEGERARKGLVTLRCESGAGAPPTDRPTDWQPASQPTARSRLAGAASGGRPRPPGQPCRALG